MSRPGNAFHAASAPVAGPARPPFEWPPATRLTYTLTGERGEGRHIYGKSTVEWRREGARYQVQFDVHISPLIDQHMDSEGTIAEDGLRPRAFDCQNLDGAGRTDARRGANSQRTR